MLLTNFTFSIKTLNFILVRLKILTKLTAFRMSDAPEAPQVVKATRRAQGNQPAAKRGASHSCGLSFQIYKCQLVYISKLHTDQETCPICKSSLTDPCNICQTNGIIDNCSIVQGECGHFFHYHCISQWIKRARTCPICNSPWQTVA